MNTIPQVFSRTASAVVVSSISSAYWYRPVANERNDDTAPREGFMSRINIYDRSDRSDSVLLTVARHIAIGFTVSVSALVLNYAGTFTVKKDENHTNLVRAVTSRPQNIPLITISNHRSVLDEPVLLANVVGWSVAVQPRFLRWSICTQNMCFQNGSALAAFFGAGKTLPIVRGDGVNQKFFLDYARRLANGEWGHIFPEAGCWQRPGSLGGRFNGLREVEGSKGNLKWGVGKLIAHAPVRPIVIPFYHYGMEHLVPQHPETRAILVKFPVLGVHKVVAVVGEELCFDDLITEHEAKYGKLWRYHRSYDEDVQAAVMRGEANSRSDSESRSTEKRDAGSEEGSRYHEVWDSRPTDYILYEKITRRIEESLHRLNDSCYKEYLKVKGPAVITDSN